MDNLVALVTGASKGIGKEIARQLAGAGLTVYVGSRDAARAERAAGEIGADTRPLVIDVTDDASIADAARHTATLDILVNNAGISGDGKTADQEDAGAFGDRPHPPVGTAQQPSARQRNDLLVINDFSHGDHERDSRSERRQCARRHQPVQTAVSDSHHHDAGNGRVCARRPWHRLAGRRAQNVRLWAGRLHATHSVCGS